MTVFSRLILIMMLWALCFPLITIGIQAAPHLTFAAMRAMVAGSVLFVLALLAGHKIPRSPRQWGLLTIIGFGATSLGFLGMFHAAEFVSPGIATVVANTQPLLAALLGVFVLNERIGLVSGVGLMIGFLGTLIIAVPQLVGPGGQTYLIGLAYIVLAATGISISNVVIKRLAGTTSGLMAMGLQLLLGSVPLAIAASVLESPAQIEWSITFVVVLLALSLLGTALVYWLWMSVLATVPLTRANAFSFLISLFGLAIGALFYGESFGSTQLIGILLAIGGVWIVSYGCRKGSSTHALSTVDPKL